MGGALALLSDWHESRASHILLTNIMFLTCTTIVVPMWRRFLRLGRWGPTYRQCISLFNDGNSVTKSK